ncbi:MAG: hypothetical protein E7529_00190 [Ruminococcaceae bacterium]|nr:hypothetical protein [Oscillospiraceae bacterium]
MKKFLSLFLTVILVFSVISPITVFAENGPHPFDPENTDITDILLSKMSAIIFMNYITDDEEDTMMGETSILYPQIDGYKPSQPFTGASYNLNTNTLTLNNVTAKNASLMLMEMGDDFKINLIGYNELGEITSLAGTRGGSVTITGNGELVVNRTKDFSGIQIDANETNSTLTVEETVKLKAYSAPEFETPAIDIYSSACLDSSEIIKLGGTVKGNNLEFKKYTVDYYEQIEAYDLEWNCYDWYEFGLIKDGVYYVADEELDEETYNYTGKYWVYSVTYDEILDCYVSNEYADGEAISLDGFTVLTENEPIYDQNLGFYIGYTDYPDEPNDSYKYIFDPSEKEFFDLCVDEKGTKYGFWQHEYEYDDGTLETDTYIYNLINHPTYGIIAVEDKNKNSLSGLTPLKIDEKDFANASIYSDVTINNGGSIIEPQKIKNITAKSTNQGVKVSWAADPVADKYRIYRKAEGAKNWTRLDTIDADETSFIDKTAKSGKKYIYTVKGYNFVGWGEFNSKGVTHTYYSAPDVSIKSTTKGVYLSWGKIAGATKYRIYRQTSGSSKWSYIDTVTGTSFTDKTAKSGKKYYYRVMAGKGETMSGYNVVSKYFLSAPKLSSVHNTTLGVKFSWEKVNSAEGYKVYRKSGSGSYKYIGTTSKTTYIDKTAKSGTTYTYTVKAYKSKTNSSYNKTGLKIKHLDAPEVNVKEYTKSVKFSWNEITGAKEYAVYRKASGESKWTKLTTTTELSYKDTALKRNTTYSYRVRAVNGKTLSGYKTLKVVK